MNGLPRRTHSTLFARLTWSALVALTLFVGLLTTTFLGCGSKNKPAEGPGAANPLEDPLAVLPPSVVLVMNVDARAFFASGAAGAEAAKLAERYLPIGQEANFIPSRDVDRVTVGVYSAQGGDVAAVLKGRFDAARLEQMAQTGTATRAGVPVVRSQYAGRTLYTVSNIGFTLLAPGTMLAGTETGMRRALDRVRDGRAAREFAPWILETLDTPGAPMAVAADLANQPAAAALLKNAPFAWIRDVRAGRMVGTFQPPGLKFSGALTYADAEHATQAADGVRSFATLANVLAVTGAVPRIKDLTAQVAQTDVQIAFGLDDSALRTFLEGVPRAIGR